MGTYVVTLSGHTATLNELTRGRLRDRIRLGKRDRQWVALACLNAGVPRAEGRRRVSLAVTLGPRQRAPDEDGLWKSPLDALVACGALVDDSPKWCERGPTTFERGGRPAMTVTLEDLP